MDIKTDIFFNRRPPDYNRSAYPVLLAITKETFDDAYFGYDCVVVPATIFTRCMVSWYEKYPTKCVVSRIIRSLVGSSWDGKLIDFSQSFDDLRQYLKMGI